MEALFAWAQIQGKERSTGPQASLGRKDGNPFPIEVDLKVVGI